MPLYEPVTNVPDFEYDNGDQGASWTLNWTNGQRQRVRLTGSTTTLTITAPTSPTNLLLRIVQDGTGSRTITWPVAVKWPGGVVPTLSTAPNAVDVISFYWDATNYSGVSNTGFA